jgi:hypothetical protein
VLQIDSAANARYLPLIGAAMLKTVSASNYLHVHATTLHLTCPLL